MLTLLTLLLSQKNKYPWVAALLSNGGQFCGGSLVASKYVVTAAHCMFLDQDATQPVSAGDITVGLNPRSAFTDGSKRRGVVKYVQYRR